MVSETESFSYRIYQILRIQLWFHCFFPAGAWTYSLRTFMINYHAAVPVICQFCRSSLKCVSGSDGNAILEYMSYICIITHKYADFIQSSAVYKIIRSLKQIKLKRTE